MRELASRDGMRIPLDAARGVENAHTRLGLELVRLVIPRRVYMQAHMDVVAELVWDVYHARRDVRGLRTVCEPRYLRFFRAGFGRL